jgi:hypothetical protein
MTQIVAFDAPHGTVLIETPDGEKPPRAGRGRTPAAIPGVGSLKSGLHKASKSLEQAIEDLTPFLTAFSKRLSSAPIEVDEASLEVGITFTAEAGIVFTGAKAEGSMTLTVKWKRHLDKADPK